MVFSFLLGGVAVFPSLIGGVVFLKTVSLMKEKEKKKEKSKRKKGEKGEGEGEGSMEEEREREKEKEQGFTNPQNR